MANHIEVRWGSAETLPLDMPPAWQVMATVDVSSPEPIACLTTAVQRGLEEPIGAPPLPAPVGPDTRIALVMDDARRPTPVVLDPLREARARPENVTGVFAGGTHKVLGPEEMEARAGTSVVSRIPGAAPED